MSSPIPIPRRASSPTPSESEASSLSNTGSLYVPVHKRGASPSTGSVSSAPSSSPSSSSSWRGHPSANPMAAFNSKSRKAHNHKKPEPNTNNPSNDASKRTHIPESTTIPTTTTTTPTPINITIHVPFVYPIADLLTLSSAPAPLSGAQIERLRAVLPVAPESADKAAARRRRVGRPRKNATLSQKPATNTADVEVRRARHGPGHPHAHGSWGWNANAPLENHPHDLEACWRHAPVLAVA